MAKQTLNIGSTANDGTGTTLRDGGDLINDNFNEIYSKLGSGTSLYSLTFPNATDTVVGRATTDTLTNKTISGSSNTLSNIANSSLSNSSITFAGDSGSDSASLGETYTIAGGTSISTTATSNTVTINLGSINATTTAITNVPTPSADTDPVNKAYADSIAEGLHVHESVHALVDSPLATITGDTVTYDNGTSGVGATLTMSTALDLSTDLDGHVVNIGERVIINGETNAAHNGIYVVNSTTELERATDFDTPTEMAGGDFIWVTHGATYEDTGWVMSEAVTTVGTSDVTFVQFSGAGSITAGDGLSKTGSTLNVNVDDSSLEINADTLRVKALGVTNAMLTGSIANSKLTNSSVTFAGDTGSDGVSLGETYTIAGGTSISTIATSNTMTINLGSIDASATTISNIPNSSLSNSTITMAADSGTADPVSLGETFTVDGGQSITTTVSANQVSIAVTANSISSTQLASASTLLIKNSAGSTLKTVIGAGV